MKQKSNSFHHQQISGVPANQNGGIMEIQKIPVKMEATMELRWAVELGASKWDAELQQAFWIIGESSKQKVWCPVSIHIKEQP